MTCPLFEDYTRSCLKVFPTLISTDSLKLCTSEDYEKECVFYRFIERKEPICDYAKGLLKCPLVTMVSNEQFVDFAWHYCLCEKFTSCERYHLKNQNEEVPDGLLPDGTQVKK